MATFVEEIFNFDLRTDEAVRNIQKLADEVQGYRDEVKSAEGDTEKQAKAQDKLAAASKKLETVLGQESKTLNGLNAKKEALAKIQANLNVESKEFVEVGKQIAKVENEIAEATANAAGEQSKLTSSLVDNAKALGGLAVAAVAVGGITEGFSALNETVKETAKELNDVKLLFPDLEAGEVDTLTAKIKGTAGAFDQEFNEVLQAANALSKELGISGQEALDVINKGFISGANVRGDFLEQLKEYPAFIKQAGLTAEQGIAVITKGEQLGVFSDKAIDAVKELTIRVSEGTKTTRDAVVNAFGQSFSDELFARVEAGVITPFEAAQELAEKLSTTDINPQQYAELVAGIGGGALEDAGRSFFEGLVEIDGVLVDLEGNLSTFQAAQVRQIELNEQLGAAQVALTRELEGTSLGLANLGLNIRVKTLQALLTLVNALKALPKFVQENRAALLTLGTALVFFNKNLILSTALTLKKAAAEKLAAIGSKALATATRVLNATLLANPIFAVVGAVLAAVAAYKLYNSESRAAAREQERLNEAVKNIQGEFIKEKANIDKLFGSLNDANTSTAERSRIIDEIQNKYGDYLGNINLEKASQDELAEAYSRVNDAVLQGFVNKAKLEAQRNIFDEILTTSQKLQDVAPLSPEGLDLLTQAAQNGAVSLTELEIVARRIAAESGRAGELFKVAKEVAVQGGLAVELKELNDELRTSDARFAKVFETIKASVSGFDLSALAGDEGAAGGLEKLENNADKAGKTVDFVAGSIASLKADLAALQTQLEKKTSLTDTDALKQTLADIDKLKEEIDAAEKLLDKLRGAAFSKEAQKRIEALNIKLIDDDFERQIEQARAAAKTAREKVIGDEQQQAKQIELINEALGKKVAEIREKQSEKLKADNKALDKLLAEIPLIKAQAKLDVEIVSSDTELAEQLTVLEKARQNELSQADLTGEQVEEINKFYARRKVELERASQIAILKEKIKAADVAVQVAEKLGEGELEAQKKAAALKLQLAQLEGEQLQADVDLDLELNVDEDGLKEKLAEVAEQVEQLSQAVFSGVGQFFDAEVSRTDALVQRQKQVLADLLADTENVTAEQVEIEREKLAQLEEERRRAVERQQALALAELTANSLVAVSKAAAEGGAGAAFTIAATLIALAAGLASARAQAQAAFYTGTDYVEANGNPSGRDTVPARLTIGEGVLQADKNALYSPTFKAMRRGSIPPELLNEFTNAYLSRNTTALGSLLSGMSGGSLDVTKYAQESGINVSGGFSDNKRLEALLQASLVALEGLPSKMPTASFNISKKGIFTMIKNEQSRQERASKIAK